MEKRLVRSWMTERVVTVTPSTHLADARRIMSAENIRALPVMKDERLVGIVTRRGLLRADLSPLTSNAWQQGFSLSDVLIGDIMTVNPICVSSEAPVARAARIMMENKITALPVLDAKEKLCGILTSSDLFRVVIEECANFKKAVLVRDYMTPEVVTIPVDTSLLEAHRIMGINRIRSLPIVDDNQNHVGIVTRTDLMNADQSRVAPRTSKEAVYEIEGEKVERIMSRRLITVRENSNITLAAELMLKNKIHSLPVLNNNQEMVGILTETDLFRLIVKRFI